MTAKKALKEATDFLKQFKGILDLHEQIEEAGSIENLIAARKRELQDLNAKVSGISGKLAEADAEARKRVSDGEAEANDLRANAGTVVTAANALKAEADKVMAAAKAVAEKMVADAKAESVAVQQGTAQTKGAADALAADIVAKAQARAAEIDRVAASRQDDVHALDNEITDRSKKLAALKSELAAITARLGAI